MNVYEVKMWVPVKDGKWSKQSALYVASCLRSVTKEVESELDEEYFHVKKKTGETVVQIESITLLGPLLKVIVDE